METNENRWETYYPSWLELLKTGRYPDISTSRWTGKFFGHSKVKFFRWFLGAWIRMMKIDKITISGGQGGFW